MEVQREQLSSQQDIIASMREQIRGHHDKVSYLKTPPPFGVKNSRSLSGTTSSTRSYSSSDTDSQSHIDGARSPEVCKEQNQSHTSEANYKSPSPLPVSKGSTAKSRAKIASGSATTDLTNLSKGITVAYVVKDFHACKVGNKITNYLKSEKWFNIEPPPKRYRDKKKDQIGFGISAIGCK